jgi:hypothetical protein
MQTYRLYGLGPDGEVLFAEELRAATQADAVAAGEQALARAPRVELWQEAVRIFHRRADVAAVQPAPSPEPDRDRSAS